MSVSPSLDIYYITVMTISCNAIQVPLSVPIRTDKKIIKTTALIDSEAGG